MVMIRMVGYYRVAAGVSSMCVSSWGAICERVCLVMSFLKGVGGDEPSPGLSPLPPCVGHLPALSHQGRALRGHFDVFNWGMQAGVRHVRWRERLWLCAAVIALKGAGSPWPEWLWGLAGRVGAMGLWSEGGCIRCGCPSGGWGLVREVGSKQQRCRMQHARGVGGTHTLGYWAQHGEALRPQPGWEFFPKTVFPTPKQFGKLNPNWGWHDDVR